MSEYTLTVEVPIRIYGGGRLPDVGAALNTIFRDWRDGRYPFQVEMLTVGLEQCFNNAIYMAIQKDCQEKHGDEMVQVDENTQRSKWSMESERIYEEYKKSGRFPHFCDDFSARIEDK
jgi:hypothetical protein